MIIAQYLRYNNNDYNGQPGIPGPLWETHVFANPTKMWIYGLKSPDPKTKEELPPYIQSHLTTKPIKQHVL